jgi:protein-glucosylgalactosylhydroxylysine glucosidase
MRLPHIPVQRGTCIVNGFAGLHPEALVECAPPAPFPLALGVTVNGVRAREAVGACHFERLSYDFRTGEVRRAFTFAVGAVKVAVEVLCFCSRTIPALVPQEITATCDSACQLEIEVGIDPTGVPGRFEARATQASAPIAGAVDGSCRWASLGGMGSCGAAYVSECDEPAAERSLVEGRDVALKTTFKINAQEGRTYRIRQFSAMVPSAAHALPDQQAVRLAAEGMRKGFEDLRKANAESWREIWKARPLLLAADERWQRIADASFFYLHSSVHASSLCSTSLFGLAQWPNYHYYYGHPMWDLETFCIPVLSLTAPDCAESMLEYRSDRLPQARSNAKLWGYRGAQFPWESSMLSGDEASPGGGSAAAFEHHVSIDIALAFLRHAQLKGDRHFTRDVAWPVVREVGEWLESRVVPSDRGYEIRDVNGVAERKQTANNNAYMNMSSAVLLREASLLADHLGEQSPDRWRDIASRLVLPLDEPGQTVVSHDGFRRDEEQGEAPEPLAGIFPVGYQLPADLETSTLRYFLAKKGEGYIGSPMLSALYGVWGARLGDRALSAELFETGFGQFIQEPFMEADEYSDAFKPEHPRVGPFFANLGGFLSGCLYGLGCLSPGFGDPATWVSGPATMPALWDGVEVQRLWVRGNAYTLRVMHGRQAELSRI